MPTDSFGDPIFQSFPFAVAAGLLSGSNVTVGRANGYIGTAAVTAVAVRATTYTPQGSNAQRSVVSTNGSDTSAGTGARTITLNYLDTSFVVHTETITMNGTTPVNTVGTNIAYIENIVIATVGSGGGNAGTIQVLTGTGGGGSVWGSIAAGDNQTFWAHHYVPTGVTCYVIGITGGGTVSAGQTNLQHSGNPGSANLPQLQIGDTIIHVGAGTWDHDYDVPLVVPGPDFIWVVERPIIVSVSTAVGSFDYCQF